MAQLTQRHLVRKTDFPLPPSSPFPSPSPSLQTTKPEVCRAAAAFPGGCLSAAGDLTLVGWGYQTEAFLCKLQQNFLPGPKLGSHVSAGFAQTSLRL